MFKHLVMAFLKWRLGVWIVRKMYANDRAVFDRATREIGALKLQIRKIAPVAGKPLRLNIRSIQWLGHDEPTLLRCQSNHSTCKTGDCGCAATQPRPGMDFKKGAE